jgi:hypothetical protein
LPKFFKSYFENDKARCNSPFQGKGVDAAGGRGMGNKMKYDPYPGATRHPFPGERGIAPSLIFSFYIPKLSACKKEFFPYNNQTF